MTMEASSKPSLVRELMDDGGVGTGPGQLASIPRQCQWSVPFLVCSVGNQDNCRCRVWLKPAGSMQVRLLRHNGLRIDDYSCAGRGCRLHVNSSWTCSFSVRCAGSDVWEGASGEFAAEIPHIQAFRRLQVIYNAWQVAIARCTMLCQLAREVGSAHDLRIS